MNSGSLNSGTLNFGTLNSGTLNIATLNSCTLNSGTLNSGTLNSGTLNSGTLNSGTNQFELVNKFGNLNRIKRFRLQSGRVRAARYGTFCSQPQTEERGVHQTVCSGTLIQYTCLNCLPEARSAEGEQFRQVYYDYIRT